MKINTARSMVKRPLGKTGIHVSEIAFGGVEIGMPYGIGVNTPDDMLSEAEAMHLLHAALDSGINFFDTARQYGKSESIIGKAFRDRREQVVLTTKCKHLRERDGRLPSPAELRKNLDASFIESLKELQTEYIDLYMLHDSDKEILECDEVLHFFEHLKRSGAVRATGVSTYTPDGTKEVIASQHWDVIQVPFNLMDQRQESFFPMAAQHGIGIVVRSVLLKGLLSEKGKLLHPALKEVESHIRLYDDLVKKNSTDLPTLATKFALSFNEVSAILVGIDRVEYLEKSLVAANGNYLTMETLQQMQKLAYPDPDFLNLHTWSLRGWLK
jgi:aryl-alcohol dehydrogenase-like predicted oxidoreductase